MTEVVIVQTPIIMVDQIATVIKTTMIPELVHSLRNETIIIIILITKMILHKRPPKRNHCVQIQALNRNSSRVIQPFNVQTHIKVIIIRSRLKENGDGLKQTLTTEILEAGLLGRQELAGGVAPRTTMETEV